MFRDIEADCYLMVDGDDTYPAEQALELCRPILEGAADMTVGDRLSNGTYAAENQRAFHGFGNNLVRGLIRIIYGYTFNDVMTGYRAMSRLFVKTMPVLSPGFQIECELSIHAVDKRWRIVEVPIVYRDRPAGSESKLSTVHDGVRVVSAITGLFKDYRPLKFFMLVAAVLMLLRLVAGVPVIAEFAATGLVTKLPSTVLAVGLVFCGALALATGPSWTPRPRMPIASGSSRSCVSPRKKRGRGPAAAGCRAESDARLAARRAGWRAPDPMAPGFNHRAVSQVKAGKIACAQVVQRCSPGPSTYS
ncbi:hypothetical protein [Collinsella intestinalis]|uniref:hypothetical protein n=1 Tax=Collinsella intestinalis TaxID=147207 RepID=UPI001EF4C353|nr:hypothetical protein [Collinsella intestinalis]